MTKDNFCIILLIIFALTVANAALAQTTLEVPLIGGQTSVSTPAEYIRMVFIFGLGLVGITALFAMVLGGFIYLLAGDNESRKTSGKDWIWGGISGLVLLLCSWLILYTINPQLVSLTNPKMEIIIIPRTVDNYIPSEATGYSNPQVGTISSTLQNLSQYAGQLNSSNTTVVIDKSDRVMRIYKDGQLIGEAPINIGVNDPNGTQIGGVSGDKITPVGDFVITNDIRYSEGGVYSGQFGSNMGPAFLGLSCADQNGSYRGIGIHGSANDNLNGTYGCVRVHNADVVLLYNNLKPGTPVKIQN